MPIALIILSLSCQYSRGTREGWISPEKNMIVCSSRRKWPFAMRKVCLGFSLQPVNIIAIIIARNKGFFSLFIMINVFGL